MQSPIDDLWCELHAPLLASRFRLELDFAILSCRTSRVFTTCPELTLLFFLLRAPSKAELSLLDVCLGDGGCDVRRWAFGIGAKYVDEALP